MVFFGAFMIPCIIDWPSKWTWIAFGGVPERQKPCWITEGQGMMFLSTVSPHTIIVLDLTCIGLKIKSPVPCCAAAADSWLIMVIIWHANASTEWMYSYAQCGFRVPISQKEWAKAPLFVKKASAVARASHKNSTFIGVVSPVPRFLKSAGFNGRACRV